MNRQKELMEILNKASYEYYQKDNSIMTDKKYDELYDELIELEKKGVVYNNSPTQKVGFQVISSLQKITHEYPMLSLDKTKEIEKLKSFLSDQKGILSWKLDGLTVVLNYDDGKLIKAITRGNGTIGEDITHNAKVFANIPIKIKEKKKLIVRGEAIIPYWVFEEINSELEEENKYKNPRNLCSGTVRQLNNQITKERKVSFIAFNIVNIDDFSFSNEKINSYKFLEENGFQVVKNALVDSKNLEKTVKKFENEKEINEFATDGLVLTYNLIDYSKNLGSTSKFPKDSIAFKWTDEIKETILLNVEWSTSRTGVINPVAIFEDVELEGTTVNRASLHNISIIEGLELGIGDKISVYKANMIIPQIYENLTCSNSLEIPKNCPNCNSPTEIRQTLETKNLYCTNKKCSGIILDSIVHFTSRNAMNIEGLSEETIKKFIDLDYINSVLDIYTLKEKEEEIVCLKGFGKKSYNKLYSSIEKSKNVKLANFIFALGINGVGLSIAKLIEKNLFCTPDLNTLFSITYDDLIEIDGIGHILANSFIDFFSKEETIKLINNFKEILKIEVEEKTTDITLKDLQFCITGSLEKYKNRKELEDLIEKMGGKSVKSVSSNTSFLINNDLNSNSSKNKKARELNIPIISEEDFIKRWC